MQTPVTICHIDDTKLLLIQSLHKSSIPRIATKLTCGKQDLDMRFTEDDRRNYGAHLKERERAVKAAQEYFEGLPMGLGSYDCGEGGRLEVAYQLPSPEAHHASYWPHKGEWKYNHKGAAAKHAKGQSSAYYHDTRLRRAASPEDFARQFAPGSFAPDALRFSGNLPARLQSFYEKQGPEALARAVERGEPVVFTDPPEPVAVTANSSQTTDDGDTNPLRPVDGWTGRAKRLARAQGAETGKGDEAKRGGEHERAPGLNRGGSSGSGGAETANGSDRGSSGRAGTASGSRKRVGQADDTASYIVSTFRVTAAQAEVVDRLLLGVQTDYPEATRRFLCHLLACGQSRDGEEELIPVAAKLIFRELGVRCTERVWMPLLDAGLIEWRWESKETKLSRRFALRPSVRDRFLVAVPRVGDPRGTRFVDLVSGRASKRRAYLRYKTDSDGRSYPALIGSALAELRREGCPVDLRAAEAHVDGLWECYGRATEDWERAGRPVLGPENDALKTAQGRWRTDHHCLNAMKEAGPTEAGNGIWRCVPYYERDLQRSGRLTEVGGLQNCSRKMRHAALAGLRHSHDVRNYDLVGSQAWGLVQLFEDAEIDTGWLKTYVRSDKGKYAEQAFGDRSAGTVDLWKACLFALFMGAVMPSTAKDPPSHVLAADGLRRKPMEIAKGVRDAFGGGYPTEEAQQKLASFRAVVQPFLTARDAWHDALEARSASDQTFAVPGRGGRYVTNAAGMTFRTDDKAGFPLRSKLAAHLLQGLEASFIHRLTALGPTFGFSAVNNQHDGLLTVGPIPPAAIEQAQADSGLRYATLKEKRYHPDLPVPGLMENVEGQ